MLSETAMRYSRGCEGVQMQSDNDEAKVEGLSRNNDFRVGNRESEARQGNLTVG